MKNSLAHYASFAAGIFNRRTGIPVYTAKESDLVSDLGYRGDRKMGNIAPHGP